MELWPDLKFDKGITLIWSLGLKRETTMRELQVALLQDAQTHRSLGMRCSIGVMGSWTWFHRNQVN